MLRLFNTFSRKKEVFRPIGDKRVGLYTCGPSVYAYPHIGNYRTYLFEDVLKRYLLYKGYKVKHVMNLTDVEDKSIREVRKRKKPLEEITRFYTNVFFRGAKALHIIPADVYPRATHHVGDMARLIRRLLEGGYAYRWDDGNIYYKISKFKNYGRLSKLRVTKEMSRRRVWKDDYDKWEAGDFILWKSYRKSDGNVFWVTELGKGRPGWNIECSAMSMRYLGEHFDIHTGGVDNIFSHHENEIAQSEGATGKKFVNYWLHARHLMVNGRKMSKSLGNCYRLEDLTKRGYEPMVIRYVLLSTHYRRRLNFTFKKMQKANRDVGHYCSCIRKIKNLKGGRHSQEVHFLVREVVQEFEKAMDDDLNTENAIEAYFKFIRRVHILAVRRELDERNEEEVMDAVKRINSVLGFLEPCSPLLSRKECSKFRVVKSVH